MSGPLASGGAVAPVSGTASQDTRWYQRAVFYEVLVRGFFDANNDGT
jgi:maltose alpha-D-glucosyltransferase/alpha-amylase